MKRIVVAGLILALWLFTAESSSLAQRRGGGGFRGGSGGARSSGHAAVGTYGGSSIGSRSSSQVVGPRGGTGGTRSGSGSITTPRGGTIDYKGAAAGGSTARGVTGGKYIGGVQVTTAGGHEVTKVGKGGAAVGPGGNAVGGRSGAWTASGAGGGSASGAYRGGVAIGPHGAAAGGTRVGTATGPAGTTVGGASRGGVAVGPHGAVAGRTTAVSGAGGTAVAGRRTAVTSYGTYHRSAVAVRGQGVYVRQSFTHYDCFSPRWYARYPGAWFAAGWVAGTPWRAATWGTVSSYAGYSYEPVYYDYGSNIVYQDNSVYIDGEKAGSTDEYVEKATQIASTGKEAKPEKNEDFMPLGVFALVQGEEQTAYHIFQLALSKKGVIRGTYYNAVTDSTETVYGSVDAKTQRAAWTVGDRKSPVYEAGIANLTRDETTVLIHYSKEKTQQWTLVRIEQPKEGTEKPM